jgi:SLT domain-containing protein
LLSIAIQHSCDAAADDAHAQETDADRGIAQRVPSNLRTHAWSSAGGEYLAPPTCRGNVARLAPAT